MRKDVSAIGRDSWSGITVWIYFNGGSDGGNMFQKRLEKLEDLCWYFQYAPGSVLMW
jgi:hypothetical protein